MGSHRCLFKRLTCSDLERSKSRSRIFQRAVTWKRLQIGPNLLLLMNRKSQVLSLSFGDIAFDLGVTLKGQIEVMDTFNAVHSERVQNKVIASNNYGKQVAGEFLFALFLLPYFFFPALLPYAGNGIQSCPCNLLLVLICLKSIHD